ncbi:MAG: amylo-alpha-1,6-glucosidase [Methanotrichaceae archaeon]
MPGYILRPNSFAQGTSREWLIANGLGGYASSTAVGANTRAYHGLLVAAISPPAERRLLLSSLDEEIDGVQLANHQYPGAVHPQGFKYLSEFGFDPLPRFSYMAGNARVDKIVFILHGRNTTIANYRIQGEGRIKITPLVHCRNFHATSGLPEIRQEASKKGTVLRSSCDLFLLSDIAEYTRNELIYYNFEYEAERLRGLSWKENLFSPGYFGIEVSGNTEFGIMASSEESSMPDLGEARRRESSRIINLKAPLPRFAQAADSFIVRRGQGRSIIAGYHWFNDWGRDAMLSLPGLLLSTERFKDAKEVLMIFAEAMKDGVMPNDLGARSYNTVDASLLFIRAVYNYYSCSSDAEFIRGIWPTLRSIIERYSGKGEGFGMDSDGLIKADPALTWMDARVDGRPVTPRAGKACEINALWYDDLRIMESFARVLEVPWDTELSSCVKESYQRFWNSETGCLFDVIDHEDASIRPNQIMAVSVDGLLPMIKRKRILETVTRELLTPYGLRTLSPRDPRYQGRHEGEPKHRDAAYHQGTVWPWLIGPYIDAFLSVNGLSDESKVKAREILRPLAELDIAGINTIPELFDGDEPHRPGGCISQAWSVAELLRAWGRVQ